MVDAGGGRVQIGVFLSGARDLATPEPENLEALSRRLAGQCRHVVQACLREEEWLDADQEFSSITAAGLLERDKRAWLSQ